MIEVTAEGRAEVEAALRRRDVSPRVRERLEMVKAAALGRELRVIVEWSGRGERTVVRWLGAYAFGGVGALCDAPRSGRPVSADRAYLGALGEAVDTPPRSLGLGFDVWTSDRLFRVFARRLRETAVWSVGVPGRGDAGCASALVGCEHCSRPAWGIVRERSVTGVGGRSTRSRICGTRRR